MLTKMEQEIVDKVKAERAKYKQLVADPPHEQDNIPNPFAVLTDEEFRYVRENPQLLKLIE